MHLEFINSEIAGALARQMVPRAGRRTIHGYRVSRLRLSCWAGGRAHRCD
ncbi:hypothetical protein PATSB16_11570 [Pandoraea thiooxydans]|nr:hypothetical protein PATSB16_11570 [Pandoraea thiooxydans]